MDKNLMVARMVCLRTQGKEEAIGITMADTRLKGNIHGFAPIRVHDV